MLPSALWTFMYTALSLFRTPDGIGRETTSAEHMPSVPNWAFRASTSSMWSALKQSGTEVK